MSLSDALKDTLAEKNLTKIQKIIDELESIMSKEKGGDYSFFPLSEPLHKEISLTLEHGEAALVKILEDAFRKRLKFKRRGIDRYPSNKNYFHPNDLNSLIRTSMRLHYWNNRFPKVKFSSYSKVFTFGSCFAVNIHKYLAKKHIHTRCLPMIESLNSPQYNLKYLKSIYKYDSKSMGFLSSDSSLNRITIDARDKIEFPFLKKDGTWFTTRHADRGAILKKEIRKSDLIIFTVGTALISPRGRRDDPVLETVESQKSAIKQVTDEILKINHNAHIVLTLSPIPIELILDWDKSSSAVEADCVQKSISRVAMHELFSKDFKDVDNISYFPSFEIVRWLTPLTSVINPNWIDFHHPDPKVIESIATIFESVYFKASYT